MAYPDLRIGIALSGGGARGSAHVGVLKALLEEGIVPTVVSGTSAGAIVGALYAHGLSVEAMTEFVKVSNQFSLLRVGLPFRGLMKLSMLKERLDLVLKDDDFKILDYPLAVAATNLGKGVVEIFRSGPLIPCIQASSAIPLVFQAVLINGQLYGDGGIFMNLPAAPIRDEVDVLIGSNVLPLVETPVADLSNVVTLGNRVFELSAYSNTQHAKQLCDFVVEPASLCDFSVYNFTRSSALIEAGYMGTMERMPDLKRLLEARQRAGVHPDSNRG